MEMFKSSDVFISHHRREILIWNNNKKPWKGFKKGKGRNSTPSAPTADARLSCGQGFPL